VRGGRTRRGMGDGREGEGRKGKGREGREGNCAVVNFP